MRLTHKYQALWQTWNCLYPEWEFSVPAQSCRSLNKGVLHPAPIRKHDFAVFPSDIAQDQQNYLSKICIFEICFKSVIWYPLLNHWFLAHVVCAHKKILLSIFKGCVFPLRLTLISAGPWARIAWVLQASVGLPPQQCCGDSICAHPWQALTFPPALSCLRLCPLGLWLPCLFIFEALQALMLL